MYLINQLQNDLLTYTQPHTHMHIKYIIWQYKVHSQVQLILKALDQNFSDISLNTYNICIWRGRDFTAFFKLFTVQPTSSYYYFKTTKQDINVVLRCICVTTVAMQNQ